MAQTPSSNPVAQPSFRVAAVGDLHCTKASAGSFAPWLEGVSQHADVLLLCGDLTDYGLPEEAHVLVKEIMSVVRIPVLAVLGNHDVESGMVDEVTSILTAGGIAMLEGNPVEIQGVGFAGVKGFCGGFGRRMIEPWGESIFKSFAREAVNEGLKLESDLAKLRTPQRVAVLHYSPIETTVEGEPREIYPFLG